MTWGVFPGKEIVQPTIVETISFLAWKDEAYRLGSDWAKCYSSLSPSRQLIDGMMENWYLVNIVDNDFHSTHGVFALFDGLEVPGIDDRPKSIDKARSDNREVTAELNGIHKPDDPAVFDQINN